MKFNLKTFSLGLALVGIGSLWLGALLLRDSEGYWFTGPGERAVSEEKTVSAAGVQFLEVSTVSTDVRWHETEDARIRVRLSGVGGPSSPVLSVVEREGALDVEVRYRPRFPLIHPGPDRTTLDVYAPRTAWKEVKIQTVSGDAELADLQVERFTYRTVSGNLNARLEGPVGETRLSTTSGDLELDLPDDARFSLEATTTSGNLSCAFPLTVSGAEHRRRLAGTVGGGGASLQARTVSGDVRLY